MTGFNWTRISLTLLRSFDAVARHLSYSQAAEELGRSQATLSVQVRELERQLGLRLLDRTTRRVTLTDPGADLSAAVEEGFKIIGTAVVAARKVADRRRSRIVVGCVPSLASVRLPSILAGYRLRDGATQIDIEELNYVDMVKAILDGQIDFGIGPCSDPPPGQIAFNRVVEDALCVALPAKPEYEKLETASVELLASLPLIFLKGSLPLQTTLSEVALSHDVHLKARMKVGHVQTAIGMVREGAGAAIVPRMGLSRDAASDLKILPIDGGDASLSRWIGLLTYRGRRLDPVASRLSRYVRSTLAKDL